MPTTNNNTNDNQEAQQLLSDIEATNKQAEDFLTDFDEKLLKLDFEYAKMEAKHDVETLKLAKKILEEKKE